MMRRQFFSATRPRLRVAALAAVLFSGAMACGTAAAGSAAEKAADKAATRRAAVEQVIHDYLLAHPEVIGASLVLLQQREVAAEAAAKKQALAANHDDLLADPSSPVLGNPSGDVTVVEFFDYRCGYCKRVAPAVTSLLAADANVRLVLKELPILGPDSLLAAKSALAAHKQGRYADFHAALLAAPSIDEAAIDKLATDSGLDVDRFRADRTDAATTAAIEKNHRLAQALGINGTPAFIVGDRVVPGAADAATLAGYVAAVRGGRQPASK